MKSKTAAWLLLVYVLGATATYVTGTSCSRIPFFGDLRRYREYVLGHGYKAELCAPGTSFEYRFCSCTFDNELTPGGSDGDDEISAGVVGAPGDIDTR